MTLAIYVDLGLAALLVATVFYAARLNRRLGMLRRDRGELTALIAQFTEATAAAETAMEGLRASADSSGRSLQEAVEKARATAGELGFLVQRGEQAADRLDAAIRSGRGMERTVATGQESTASAAASGGFRHAVETDPATATRSRSAQAERMAGGGGRAALLKAIERME